MKAPLMRAARIKTNYLRIKRLGTARAAGIADDDTGTVIGRGHIDCSWLWLVRSSAGK